MSTPLTADERTIGLRLLRRGRRCLAWGLLALALVGVASITGCASTLDFAALKPGSKLDKPESIDGIMGPTERKLKQVAWERQKKELSAARHPQERAALAEYEAAQKLFDAGRYDQSEKAFKALAKSRRWSGLSWAERTADAFRHAAGTGDDPAYGQYGDPLEEDALFMIAEAQFARKKFSWAQDSYDRLLEKYPSSRHLDTTTRRLFDIAHTWMGFPQADEKGDVELASGELLKTNPRLGAKDFAKPSFFNVADRTRPVFDTSGRALQALQSIWLHDANGPLADDALMLTANYHLQTGDFVEAARVYQLLREQYPDSPHFKDAYVLESHVRLAAYEGPGYDAKGLRESKQLKETARDLFPDLTPQQREMLDKELENIAVAEEMRAWHEVQFYKSKGDDAAVALQCNKILHRYPDSRFAPAARRELEAIADRRRGSAGFTWFGSGSAQQATSPVLAGIGSPRVASAQPKPADAGDSGRSDVSSDAPAVETKNDDPTFFRRFLRRAQTDPQLQPVEQDPRTTSADADGNTKAAQTGAESAAKRSLF